MAHASICPSCLAIPLASLFNTPQRDVPLRKLGQVWSQTGCSACHLFRHAIANCYGTEYVETMISSDPELRLYASQSPVDPRQDWNTLYRGKGTAAFYIEFHTRGPKAKSLERVAKKTDDEFNESWLLPKMQLFRPDQELDGTSPAGAYGKVTLRDAVDWHYIRDWIRACDKKHVSGSSADFASIPLLIISIDEMRIVPMPQSPVRYIALSYMWGKDQAVKLKRDNYSVLATKGSLERKDLALSRTVRDALLAAKKLECSYLWIDALCIIQDDPAHLRANVDAMDKVYAGAWLTIVAAAGNDADGGLPGVYPDLPRSETQMRIDIAQNHGSPLTVGNMLDSVTAALNFSTWDTRGWTYQERVLSRRLLAFTHSQAYFYCGRGCSCREDMYPIADAGDEEMWHPFNAGYELSFEYDDIFTIYASAVARYTKRQLTNASDKINAFQGVLNRLAGPFRGPFILGLPSTLFYAGLLWEPAGRCTRASGEFPSWSWAGWDGAIRYITTVNFCECVASYAKVETLNGLCLSIASSDSRPSPRRPDGTVWQRNFDEDTLGIHYSTTDNFGAGYRYPVPIQPVENPSSQQGQAQGAISDRNLRIRGSIASFLVSNKHSREGGVFSPCPQGIHTHCRLELLDSGNRVVGNVLVDGDGATEISGKRHRFLAISRSTLYRVDDDPSWDSETRCFRPWTHQDSGCPAINDENESSGEEGDAGGLWSSLARRNFFDQDAYNRRVFWPTMNVLMLSDVTADGIVERVGLGKVHVDGFLPIAQEEDILLG